MFKDDKESQQFLQEERKTWTNTQELSKFKASDFDAIFYPGGHGPVFDLADDQKSKDLIRDFYEAGKPTAAVCHGPVVFYDVKLADNSTFLVKGKTVTGFTNVEEEQVGLMEEMRKAHVLEDRLKDNGATFVNAEPWGEKVVTDGNLITGQNPASARGVGEAIAKALGV
jgi:putative intracellular protease/amidase